LISRIYESGLVQVQGGSGRFTPSAAFPKLGLTPGSAQAHQSSLEFDHGNQRAALKFTAVTIKKSSLGAVTPDIRLMTTLTGVTNTIVSIRIRCSGFGGVTVPCRPLGSYLDVLYGFRPSENDRATSNKLSHIKEIFGVRRASPPFLVFSLGVLVNMAPMRSRRSTSPPAARPKSITGVESHTLSA
jgi:hypothetical protein